MSQNAPPLGSMLLTKPAVGPAVRQPSVTVTLQALSEWGQASIRPSSPR
jgi:hypothetical protein